MNRVQVWNGLAALALTLAGVAPATHAHEGATTAFARIVVSGSTVRYSLTLADGSRIAPTEPGSGGPPGAGPDADRLAQAVRDGIRVASDAGPCAPGAGQAMPPPASSVSVTVVVDFACRTGMRTLIVRDDLADALGAGLHTLARVEWPGGTGQFAFAAESREARFDLGGGSAAVRGAGSFFLLGVEHILTGYDHLLFLLVLVLGGGGAWSAFKIITAFTLAHSVTLALAVLDVVTLPDALVEATIALSIAYVAAENLLAKQAVARRWAVSLVFGLVHGFGFAAVLRELGLPPGHVALSLGAFNLGVEAGQSAVALPLVVLLTRLRGKSWEPKLAAAISAAVLVVGLALFVERVIWS